MPTNRPFFANFLAAFRAHHAIQQAQASSSLSTTTTSLTSQTAHISSPTSTAASAARAIATSTKTAGLTTAAVQAAFSPTNPSHTHHTRHPPTSPMGRSPGSVMGGSASGGFGSRQRRGSDSSTEGGFRDALGGEKWFIGGRTAQGEERFYKLGMIRRERSGDRASLDRMSL